MKNPIFENQNLEVDPRWKITLKNFRSVIRKQWSWISSAYTSSLVVTLCSYIHLCTKSKFLWKILIPVIGSKTCHSALSLRPALIFVFDIYTKRKMWNSLFTRPREYDQEASTFSFFFQVFVFSLIRTQLKNRRIWTCPKTTAWLALLRGQCHLECLFRDRCASTSCLTVDAAVPLLCTGVQLHAESLILMLLEALIPSHCREQNSILISTCFCRLCQFQRLWTAAACTRPVAASWKI